MAQPIVSNGPAGSFTHSSSPIMDHPWDWTFAKWLISCPIALLRRIEMKRLLTGLCLATILGAGTMPHPAEAWLGKADRAFLSIDVGTRVVLHYHGCNPTDPYCPPPPPSFQSSS